jgi:hypothetical protein
MAADGVHTAARSEVGDAVVAHDERERVKRGDLLWCGLGVGAERRHRAISVHGEDDGDRGAGRLTAEPVHALRGERRAHVVAGEVGGARPEDRGPQTEPRGADRRDRGAAGR